ncbi:hypothetical protein J7E62_21330, partial [Variovorax paradoxus]|nr:hypothetical protein [Variovorax paradoxus]
RAACADEVLGEPRWLKLDREPGNACAQIGNVVGVAGIDGLFSIALIAGHGRYSEIVRSIQLSLKEHEHESFSPLNWVRDLRFHASDAVLEFGAGRVSGHRFKAQGQDLLVGWHPSDRGTVNS